MASNDVKPSGPHPAVWVVLAVAIACGAALGLTGAGPRNMRTIAYWAGAAGVILILISVYAGRRRDK